MFEQLAHDIKTVLQSPIDLQFKMGLIHEMVDNTIERKEHIISEDPNSLDQIRFGEVLVYRKSDKEE